MRKGIIILLCLLFLGTFLVVRTHLGKSSDQGSIIKNGVTDTANFLAMGDKNTSSVEPYTVSASPRSSAENFSAFRTPPLASIQILLNEFNARPLHISPAVPLTYKILRDKDFDYDNATNEALKQKSAAGDVAAMQVYANRLMFGKLLKKTTAGNWEREADIMLRERLIDEIRDLNIQAMSGGSRVAAYSLVSLHGPDNMVESIAWLKIGYALGAYPEATCLKDSTRCSVAEFNHANRDDYFMACTYPGWHYECTSSDFSQADALARTYIELYGLGNTME